MEAGRWHQSLSRHYACTGSWNLPGIGARPIYLLALRELDVPTREKIVAHLAAKFSLTAAEAEAEINQAGIRASRGGLFGDDSEFPAVDLGVLNGKQASRGQMKVWLVVDGDRDCTWLNAIYESEDLAKQHIAAMNEGWIVGQEVIAQLHEDVTDPVKRAARAEQKREWRAIQRQINAYR